MDYNKTEDAIFKRSMEIFKEGALSFFGIEEKITSPANIEIKNIDIKTSSMDYLFNTEDGNYLHFEFQSTSKTEDIARFMYYDATLYYRDRKRIKTIVVYSAEIDKTITNLSCGSINYQVEAFYMSNIDGDEKYNNLKNKLERGEKLDKKDIVTLTFIPIMKSKKSKASRAIESLDLAKTIKDDKIRTDCITLIYALFEKFADSELKKRFREVFTMTEIGKMIYEDGVKAGEDRGKAIGKAEGNAELIIKQLVKKFKKIPEEYKIKIKELPQETLDVLGMDIFDLNSVEDVEKYL
ncbi:DUF4351 domain-containing protein [Oceanirhabdus sp. W0125-5]|uniref:DUF4351 domain-containing protein n=1 Tax=Oceanirhabdus sp. W0125-5 TaxID=2999116 RepID=UPI0022F32D25|nr:DUF4351 domain-containing protein [Oceanirhabdus sp. W0125-5]WBW95231.1 DUF4351 domain-containing protein [Oceanirhabdus sp. W0125-5]